MKYCLFFSLIILSKIANAQENPKFDYESYKTQSSKSLIFKFKNNFEEILSIEGFLNRNFNSSYQSKEFISKMMPIIIEQDKYLKENNLNLDELREYNVDFPESKNQVILNTLEMYKIPMSELEIILDYLKNIKKFSQYSLTGIIQPLEFYLTNIESCTKYTYLELFKDFSGYSNLENLINNVDYNALNNNDLNRRISELNNFLDCSNLSKSAHTRDFEINLVKSDENTYIQVKNNTTVRLAFTLYSLEGSKVFEIKDKEYFKGNHREVIPIKFKNNYLILKYNFKGIHYSKNFILN